MSKTKKKLITVDNKLWNAMKGIADIQDQKIDETVEEAFKEYIKARKDKLNNLFDEVSE